MKTNDKNEKCLICSAEMISSPVGNGRYCPIPLWISPHCDLKWCDNTHYRFANNAKAIVKSENNKNYEFIFYDDPESFDIGIIETSGYMDLYSSLEFPMKFEDVLDPEFKAEEFIQNLQILE